MARTKYPPARQRPSTQGEAGSATNKMTPAGSLEGGKTDTAAIGEKKGGRGGGGTGPQARHPEQSRSRLQQNRPTRTPPTGNATMGRIHHLACFSGTCRPLPEGGCHTSLSDRAGAVRVRKCRSKVLGGVRTAQGSVRWELSLTQGEKRQYAGDTDEHVDNP